MIQKTTIDYQEKLALFNPLLIKYEVFFRSINLKFIKVIAEKEHENIHSYLLDIISEVDKQQDKILYIGLKTYAEQLIKNQK